MLSSNELAHLDSILRARYYIPYNKLLGGRLCVHAVVTRVSNIPVYFGGAHAAGSPSPIQLSARNVTGLLPPSR